MIFQDEQLQFLLWLKELRGPILDLFFIVLGYMDTFYFYVALCAAVWLGFSRKWGIRVAYLELLSALFNTLAKLYFALPRPYQIIPDISPLMKPKSFGFPSGGAQASLIICGILILYWKNRLAWPVGIAYFGLISFSRMYLGVHFPIDILGGWAQGLITLAIFYYSLERIEKYAERHLTLMTVLSIAIPLIGSALLLNHPARHLFAGLTGLGMGIYLSRILKQIPAPPKTHPIGLMRAAIGIASTFTILFFFPVALNAFFIYLWISWLGALLYLI